jgi:hypothetical protein
MGLNELILKLSKSGTDVLTRNLTVRIMKIKQYLLGLKEIRVFIANSQQYGHQASSVNILRNLIRMGVPGPYTLVLSGSSMSDTIDLERKIALLIPQFKLGEKAFTLNGRTVNVVSMYPGTEKLKLADFAINGGFDDLEGKDVPYDKLNVINYVQLQPYAWHRGTNRVRIEELGPAAIINLDELSPGTNLRRRAFYVDPVLTESDWREMESGQYNKEVGVCKYLLDELNGSRIFLTTGYGFGTKGHGWSTLYNMVAGVRQAQKTITAAQKATVLIAIGVSQEDYDVFWDLIDAKDNVKDTATGEVFTPDFATFRRTSVKGFVSYVGSSAQSATVGQVKTALQKIVDSPQKVLVVFLNRIPGPLFDHLYKVASVPPLFEGQNTTELMLNFGKPYLKISSNQTDTVYGYPTLPLNSLVSGTQALDAQDRAFNGIAASSPSVWYSDRPTYPLTQLPPMTTAYLTPISASSFTMS